VTALGRVAILCGSVTALASFMAAVSEEVKIKGSQCYVFFFQVLPSLYTLTILITREFDLEVDSGSA